MHDLTSLEDTASVPSLCLALRCQDTCAELKGVICLHLLHASHDMWLIHDCPSVILLPSVAFLQENQIEKANFIHVFSLISSVVSEITRRPFWMGNSTQVFTRNSHFVPVTLHWKESTLSVSQSPTEPQQLQNVIPTLITGCCIFCLSAMHR